MYFYRHSERSKAYKLYNPVTQKIVISRDVRFDESSSFNSGVDFPKNWPSFCDTNDDSQDKSEPISPRYSSRGNSPESP